MSKKITIAGIEFKPKQIVRLQAIKKGRMITIEPLEEEKEMELTPEMIAAMSEMGFHA